MTWSIYEWVRNYHGLMPLRDSCSMHCWMSDAGWTEWKNYSQPHCNYVAWLPGSTRWRVFKSTTLGTLSLYDSAPVRSGMNTLVRKNVQQLRISKSLTCDELSVSLMQISESAKKPSRASVYGTGAYRTSDRTSSPSSKSVSSSHLWTGEHDPIQDMRDWMQDIKEANDEL